MTPIRLHLAGRPQLQPAQGAAFALERKDAAWLAVLALEGAFARDTLAAWLWPEVERKTANTSLRQRFFRLRKRAGHELVQAGESVSLLPGVVLAEDEGAAEWLAGFDYADCPAFADWLARQRALRRAQRVDALAGAAARHEAAGELAAALEQVHALLALEPLSEHAQRRLMRLHYLRGDRAAAIAAFERFERALKDELGTRPDPETLALLATVEGSAVAAPPARPGVVSASLLRPPRLVGRERELAELGRAWAAGRVFLLLGEAGMGKMRLLAEWAGAHGRAALHVAARPGDAGVPFALLARLLRAARERSGASADAATRRELARVLPELGSGLAAAGEGQRLLLQRAVEWQLGSLGEAELLLDDLHFADAASLEMLQSLVAAESLAGLRWGFAQRPGEGGAAAAALRDVLAEGQRLHELPLAPLDEAGMAALVDSLGLPALDGAALAPALVRHTGGNPLFALETLKDLVLREGGAGALPQPASVGVLIERRLKALSPPALALARVAAVAGVDFSIELAESVLRSTALELADAWAELQAAQVLSGAAFAHDLVFEATQRTLPAEIARRVHGRVAEALLRGGADPARTAQHAASAWRWPEAAEQFERAAAAARQSGRLEESAAFLARAFDCIERAEGAAAQAEGARLRGVHVDALIEAERWPETIAAAEALLARATTPLQRAHALRQRCKGLFFAGHYEEAVVAGQEAEAAALALGDAELVGRARHLTAMSSITVTGAGPAAERLLELRAWSQALPDVRERQEFERDLALALHHACRSAEAVPLLEACAAGSEARGDLAELGNVALVLGMCRARLGQQDQAAADLQRALAARAACVGAEDGQPIAAVVLASVQRCRGRFDEVLSALESAGQRLAGAASALLNRVDSELGMAWLWLGQLHRARQQLAELAARGGEGRLIGLATSLDLLIAQWHGHDEAAALQRTLASLRAEVDPREHLEADWREAEAQPGAADRLAEVEARARAMGLVAVARSVAASRVERLRLDGRVQEAARLAQPLAAQIGAGINGDGYLPQAWLHCIDALLAAGEGTAALTVLAQARRWVLEQALPHVPEPFRESFLNRNPVNRRLLSLRLAEGDAEAVTRG